MMLYKVQHRPLNYFSILQTKVCLLYVFNVIIDLFKVSNKHELQGNSSSLTMTIIDGECPLVTEGIIMSVTIYADIASRNLIIKVLNTAVYMSISNQTCD